MATDPNTVASYNANAAAYNAHVTNPADSIYHAYYEKPAMYAELPDLLGKDVISIGCGSGVDAQYLKDQGAARVVGVDISEGLIEIARRDRSGVEFTVMDMEKLDYPDESFDVAYSSLAIHYLEDWSLALKEAYRILKPGGMYIFSCGHPIDGIMERYQDDETIRDSLGTTRSKDKGEHSIQGDYNQARNNGVKRLDGVLATAEVTTYRQSFANMVGHITGAGFVIEKVVEPLPQPEMHEISPYKYDKLMKIPAFIIWVLKK